MPHHRKHHHHRTNHGTHHSSPKPKSSAQKSPAQESSTLVQTIYVRPLSYYQQAFGGHGLAILGISAITITGLAIVVAFIKTSVRAAAKREEQTRWASALTLRKQAEVEEHMADSAIRMLVAREKVANATTSMYGAATNSYASQSRALDSMSFLESVRNNGLSSTGSSQPRMIPPVFSTSLDSYRGINQGTVTSESLCAIVENGTDMSNRVVQNSWKQWEKKIRREHPSPLAQAITDAAHELLKEAN